MIILEIIITIIVEVFIELILGSIGAANRWIINPQTKFKKVFNDRPQLNAFIGGFSIVIVGVLFASFW